MKIKDSFALRQVAGTWVVLPLAETALDFNGMLTLNESGVVLWKRLLEGCDHAALIGALTAEYEVSAEEAQKDVDAFLEKLYQIGCIEE